jgi:hypothetical protein
VRSECEFSIFLHRKFRESEDTFPTLDLATLFLLQTYNPSVLKYHGTPTFGGRRRRD